MSTNAAANQVSPSGPEGADRINEQHVDVTDWSRNCLPIGVEIKGKDNFWLGASEGDLRILSALLLKPLKLVTPSGIVCSPAVSDDSEFLRQLGLWAKGAAKWVSENPQKVSGVPEVPEKRNG